MIIIYGKPNCPNCTKAKALAEAKGLNFEYKTFGSDETGTVETLTELSGGKPIRTVPQIVELQSLGEGLFERKYIGGFNEFQTIYG